MCYVRILNNYVSSSFVSVCHFFKPYMNMYLNTSLTIRQLVYYSGMTWHDVTACF